ncbi:hypothetical protein Trydic_g14274 [Trypoxylus dichotomus]
MNNPTPYSLREKKREHNDDINKTSSEKQTAIKPGIGRAVYSIHTKAARSETEDMGNDERQRVYRRRIHRKCYCDFKEETLLVALIRYRLGKD